MQFLLWILAGAGAGWLTGRILKPYGYGPLMDILSGMTGAVTGGFIVSAVGQPGQFGAVLVAFQCAVVLTVLVAFASGGQRHRLAHEVVPGRPMLKPHALDKAIPRERVGHES